MAGTDAVMRAVGMIEGLSVHELSQMEGLGIGDPDRPGSPGARLLRATANQLRRHVARTRAFPDPDEEDFGFQESSEMYLRGDREAWQAFAELCLFDSPYAETRHGTTRQLDTDGVRAALESAAEQLIRLLIRRYAPKG